MHLGIAAGAGGYLSRSVPRDGASGKPIKLTGEAIRIPSADPKKIRLGRQDANQATITWLGVVEDPVQGDAPESQVEQAAFTTQEGNAEQTTAATEMPMPEPMPPEPTPEPLPEPMQEAAQQTQAQEQSPPAPEPQSPDLVAPEVVEAQPTPVEREVIPQHTEPEVVIETRPEQEQEPAPPQPQPAQPELADEQTPLGPVVVEVEPERVDELAPPNDDPAPQRQVEAPSELMGPTLPAHSSRADQPPASQAQAAPAVAGKEGVVSDRESVASILKRAIKVDAKKLNQPIAGKGLELLTVDPKFPASVRFTQLPHNPVVLIRFNALGRVTSVKFLTDEQKEKVYNTGSRAVDEPLLNAIYQWRAKGKELEQLDPLDPDSTIEISMRILFRDED